MKKLQIPKMQILKKKRLVIIIACVMIIATAGYITTHRKSKASSANFLTATVQRGTIEESIEGNGALQPSERYTLKTKASGTVEKILVTEGTPVKQGQLLLNIKNSEVEIQAKQAELEWQIAHNDLVVLNNPAAETDSSIRSAQLKVEQYQIALKDKQEEKDKLIIKAPFAGTILETAIKAGQRVSSGTTALTIATTTEMEVVAQFSANVINSLSPGMEARIFVTGLAKTYQGKVKEIAFSAPVSNNSGGNSGGNSSSAGTFATIITVEEPDESLRPGMQTYNTVIIASDQEQDLFLYQQASGYLRYTQSEKIETEVSGTVAEIYHQTGDKIFQGEPLLAIKNEEIDRQIKEAENQLADAEEKLRQLLSPEAETVQQQQLKVAQNLQKMYVSKEQLNSLRVTAPLDGVVVSLSVITGDELSAGQELIVISNFSKNNLEISVDELDINKLQFGQEAVISIDALPDVSLTGRVIGIAQEGTTSDGVTKYPVTLEVGYTEGIKGGMTASATIKLQKKENVLRIPAEALITNNNRTMVRIVENGQPQMQPIKTGLNNGRWVEVLEGLEEGQQIVLAATSSTERNQTNMTRIRMPGGGGGMGMPGGGGTPGGTRNQGNSGNSGGYRQRSTRSN